MEAEAEAEAVAETGVAVAEPAMAEAGAEAEAAVGGEEAGRIFSSVGAAVRAARAGALVLISPGCYAEDAPLLLDKPITLRGDDGGRLGACSIALTLTLTLALTLILTRTNPNPSPSPRPSPEPIPKQACAPSLGRAA